VAYGGSRQQPEQSKPTAQASPHTGRQPDLRQGRDSEYWQCAMSISRPSALDQTLRTDASKGVRLIYSSSRKSLQLFPGAARTCVVGSGNGSDVQAVGPGVQSRHARLVLEDSEVTVEPLEGSTVKVNGRIVQNPTPVSSGDWLALGECLFEVHIPGSVPARATPLRADRHHLHAEVAAQPLFDDISYRPVHITVGRLADNDLAITSPIVSRYHARVLGEQGRYFIEDLGSTNGTFVNGRRIFGRDVLERGDLVQFGTYSFRFVDGGLRAVEGAGLVRVQAAGLEKIVKDSDSRRKKKLLADVNLAINPGEFVGIFGMSGSGKSTLMDALNGRRPASAGAVFYNGVSLYHSFDLFKPSIGYVPQQDIVHRKITIHNALLYTARLRLPEDTSLDEIDQNITRVLEKVALREKERQPIDTPAPLSGGQLKRVNLAIELISNPSILFLDEATSGLDAGTDKRMMRLFRDLTGDGKTVICVTHTLENIDACHLVIVLHSGRIAYFGPPRAVTEYFKIHKLSDVYDRLETAPAELWSEQYTNSSFHREYVANRMALQDSTKSAADASLSSTSRADPTVNHFLDSHQTRILSVRFLDLLLSDRRNLLLLLAQAPIIGLVIGLVFGTAGSLPERGYSEAQIMFILGISAVWLGCLNSAREVVKELPIYLRERSVNLKIAPYLLSKVLPLSILCLIQCAALLAVVAYLISIPGNLALRGIVLFITAMAATTMGLTVSALVSSSDKAIGMIPLLLIPQVILSNAVVKLGANSKLVAQFTMISFWSFDGLKATLANQVRPWAPLEGNYWLDVAVLLLFAITFTGTALAALKWKDRQR
jgi:ABC transport system ATP-binding/permease protein